MWKKASVSFLIPITPALGLVFAEPYLLSRPKFTSENFSLAVEAEWPELIYSSVLIVLIVVSFIAPIVVAWRDVQDERQRTARKKIDIFS